jgi:Flp pilus assembly protein TadG
MNKPTRIKSYHVAARRRITRRRGATLIEFALIVPILLALLMGIIEFSWMARNHLTLANAAREGARASAVGKTTTEIQGRVNSMCSTLPRACYALFIDFENGTQSISQRRER